MGKLTRLRQMPRHEIAYRVRERLRIEAERGAWKLGVRRRDTDAVRLPSLAEPSGPSFRRYLAEVAAPRFYFMSSAETREQVREFVAANYPDWIESAVAGAERICSHRLELLGCGTVELGATINWHCDPISARTWPVRFWADYDPVADTRFGDVKVIHELNRHQHLPRLAKAFFLSGEERFAEEAFAQIESWIEQNSEGQGINWHSSLEIAIRAMSWLWTLFLALDSAALDEARARRIGHSLFAQLRHVAAYPSLYSSPNTHLLGEAAALFVAGVLFDAGAASATPGRITGAARDADTPGEAREWHERAGNWLHQQIERQVLDDGVHGELSTYYHCYALDFFLQALVASRHLSAPFPQASWRRVERMIEFLMHVSRPGGAIPLLGDDDGGRALALAASDYHSFQDALSTGAALFCRSDFKHQSGGFHEETFWMLGLEGWRIYRAVTNIAPQETAASFPAAGYFVQRSGWGEADSHLVFDCGGMGMLNGGHGHADALSVVLCSRGADLLIDSGTSVYNGAPEWRSYFRSTRAHNTVTIDGRDQSAPGGTFRWKRRAAARPLERFGHAGVELFSGEHDGYGTSCGVIHRRRLLFCPPGYWILADDFRGSGARVLDFYYHLPPGAEIAMHEGEAEPVNLFAHNGAAGLLLYFDATGALTPAVQCGGAEPVQGWASGRYGDRKPAPVLHASMRGPVPASAITVLAPFDATGAGGYPPEPARLDAIDELALGCAIEQDGCTDFVLIPSSGEALEFMDIRMAGEFFWIRLQKGALVRAVAIQASHFSHRGAVVLDTPQPLPYLSALFSGDRAVVYPGATEDKVYVRNLRNREVRIG